MSRAPTKASALVGREEAELAPSALVPNPRNPRKHTDEQIRRLIESLRRDGQTKPVLARRANAMLIAGHGVHQAATRLELKTLRVVLLDVDQAAADRIMLGDNRSSDLSSNDAARVAELLAEIDQEDWLATGYSDEEATKVIAGLADDDLVVHKIETSDRRDTFWISVRGPLGDQAEALQRIKTLMDEIPAVQVTLGTTNDLL